MKKSVVFSTTVATIGLATVLTLTAISPSQAATSHKNHVAKSASTKTSVRHKSTPKFSASQAARQFTSVNFTINNVPSTITDAATAAKLLVVKVVPLAADATAAPATAPLPTGPAFGQHDGKGGKGHHGGKPFGPAPAGAPTAPTTGSTPPAGAPDNDGDGPQGKGGFGDNDGDHGHGRGPGMQLTNLSLSNGVLTGTIQLPGDEVANVENWGIYLSIAADSANGIVAQSSTPVMVTVTTAADLSASVTATTGDVVLTLPTV